MNVEVVRQMKVVGSTLVGLGSQQIIKVIDKAVGQDGFDYVVIDEAA